MDKHNDRTPDEEKEEKTPKMTELSAYMMEQAEQIETVEQAVRLLLEYGHFRTLSDVLRFHAGTDTPKKKLVEGLMLWNPQEIESSVDRKVRNWLNGRTRTLEKKDAFPLCRILDLSLEDAIDFLKGTTGEGIHWRDPQEIAWGYAIARRLDPGQTRELLERVRIHMEKAPKVAAPAGLTAEVYDRVKSVLYRDESALMDFLDRERENLGTFHNTAYQLFRQYMGLLEEGFGDADVESLFRELEENEKRKKKAEAEERKESDRREAESQGVAFDPENPTTLRELDGDTEMYQPEDITSREILETYLYRSLVPAVQRGNGKNAESFNAIQRSIRQNWPDEFTLSRMKSRQTDVTRKVLILLFLATDGSSSDYGDPDEKKKAPDPFDDAYYEDAYDEEIPEEPTDDEKFQDIYARLDLMLSACGFRKLDPRSPFDWMILYCICTGDLCESDVRLQGILSGMFPEE